jgi:hypothetical protein
MAKGGRADYIEWNYSGRGGEILSKDKRPAHSPKDIQLKNLKVPGGARLVRFPFRGCEAKCLTSGYSPVPN